MMTDMKTNLEDAESISTFVFQHVYFGDWMPEEREDSEGNEIPSYFHMMRHVHRSIRYRDFNVKSFHDTEKTLTVYNHYALRCLSGPCKKFIAQPVQGHLQHFRMKPRIGYPVSKTTVKDTSLWKIKDIVIKRTTQTLTDLNFLQGI